MSDVMFPLCSPVSTKPIVGFFFFFELKTIVAHASFAGVLARLCDYFFLEYAKDLRIIVLSRKV
jgi:hypothetical protein